MSTQTVLSFDVSRGRRNHSSQRAFAKVNPHRPSMRLRVLVAIAAAGDFGLSLHGLSMAFSEYRNGILVPMEMHRISGRLTELSAVNLIAKLEDRRDGDFTLYAATSQGKEVAKVAMCWP